jgi:short-subunit dehydrogenase
VTDRFKQRYGPWALVAGASEGLGEAFASALAGRGLNLVLVARRAEKLKDLASHLIQSHQIDVLGIAADLGDAGSSDRIIVEAASREIGLLVYNAAASTIGPFLDATVDDHMQTLAVNTRGPTELIHSLGRVMVDRGRGGILVMTSMSAFQGSARIATYAATKAYLLSLSEALSYELADSGIDVLACCAGATRTPNYVSSRPQTGGLFRPPEMEAEEVVEQALSALGRRPVVIAGIRNRLAHYVLHRLLPRRTAVGIMGRAMDRVYGPLRTSRRK